MSEIVARAIRMLHAHNPGLRLVVSFADPHQGHRGGIYQAGNWIYLGETPTKQDLVLNGRVLNRRAYTGVGFGGRPRKPVPKGARWVQFPGKHRYAMPLDRAMRRRLAKLQQPYPVAP